MNMMPDLRLSVAPKQRAFADLPTGTLIKQIIVWQPIGLLMMALHVMLVKESIYLFPVIPALAAWLYYNAPLAGAVVYFQILIYQNWMVSIFSPGMDYSPTYVMLGGTNFAVLATIAMIAFNRLTAPYWWNRFGNLVVLVLAALAMVVLYSMWGAAKAGPTSAAIYFRTYSTSLFAVLVGLDLGRVWGFRTLGSAFLFSVVLAICLGIIEYCIPLDYYSWVNEVTYYQLKWTKQPEGAIFYVPEDIVRHFTNVFFNVSGTERSYSETTTFRFGGPIVTPTSFAYVLSITGILAVGLKRSAWLIVILPMMVLDGAKGASFLLVLSIIMYIVWVVTPSKGMVVLSAVVLSVGYIASALIIGLKNQDYHVIGFLGGVHSLAGNPLGHGIGVGGNMSAEANAGFKMDGPGGFTKLGADFAVESAVGVLFYQVGFMSILYLMVFLTMFWKGPMGERRGNRIVPARQDIMFFSTVMIAVNGVFQEEAYSPYAAGMVLLMCACVIGNGLRQRVLYSPSRNLVTPVSTEPISRPGLAAPRPGRPLPSPGLTGDD